MKKLHLFPSFVFFLWLISSPSPAKAQSAKIALKPLEPIGMPKVQVDKMDTTLQRVFNKIPEIRLLSLKQIERFVKKRRGRRLLGCGAERDCVVDFGEALKVPKVIAGDMTTVGKGFALSLKLVDIEKKKVIRSVSAVITGTRKERGQALLELGYRLVAPEKHMGKVSVAVDVKGAKIFVDGELKATSPAPPLEVRAGAHNIRVTHPSYHDYLKFITLPFKKTLTLKVNLTAYPIVSGSMKAKGKKGVRSEGPKRTVLYRPLPWYKKWYVVTAIGVGAALLVGTATAVGIALSEDGRLDRDLTVTLRP